MIVFSSFVLNNIVYNYTENIDNAKTLKNIEKCGIIIYEANCKIEGKVIIMKKQSRTALNPILRNIIIIVLIVLCMFALLVVGFLIILLIEVYGAAVIEWLFDFDKAYVIVVTASLLIAAVLLGIAEMVISGKSKKKKREEDDD